MSKIQFLIDAYNATIHDLKTMKRNTVDSHRREHIEGCIVTYEQVIQDLKCIVDEESNTKGGA